MENYDSSSAASVGVVMALLGMMFIPILIMAVIQAVGKWKIYEKAGKPGWAALIPIYSTIVTLEIIGKPIWWIFLIIFPCTSFIFFIWSTNLLSKSYGQSEGFTIGLLLLPFIFYPILGFGNYQYIGPAGAGFAGFQPYDPSKDYQDPFNPNTPPQA
jgi:hypothetical protein